MTRKLDGKQRKQDSSQALPNGTWVSPKVMNHCVKSVLFLLQSWMSREEVTKRKRHEEAGRLIQVHHCPVPECSGSLCVLLTMSPRFLDAASASR